MTPSTAPTGMPLTAPNAGGFPAGGPVDRVAGSATILPMGSATVALLPVRRDYAERTRDAVQRQRDAARDAFRLCAKRCDAPANGWTQRPNGAPRPNHGWHWSISHKRRWACAALSRVPVGIDIEEIAARRVPLYDEIGSEEEWAMLGGRTWPAFFRLWTTKEATLKANGVGIGAMGDCRLKRVADDAHSVATYRAQPWDVEHTGIDNHIVAVATPRRSASG